MSRDPGEQREQRWRPIAPASRLERPSYTPPVVQIPKRKVAAAACDTCRNRKVKCDAERPTCGRCTKSGQACHYGTDPSETRATARKRKHEELEQRVADGEALQGLLMRHPDQTSVILNRLRTGPDPRAAIEVLNDGDLLLHLAPRNQDETVASSPTLSTPPEHQTDAQGELNQYRYLIRRLRTMPEAQALESIRHLRETPSRLSGVEALSSTTKSELNLIRLSNFPVCRSTSPPIHSRIELELQISHSCAYPSLELFDPKSIDVDSWFRPSKKEQTRPEHASAEHVTHIPQSGSGSTLPSPLLVSEGSTLNSAHAQRDWEICDPRLKSLRMAHWTNVPIDDKLASAVLSHFLTVHYPIFAFFDADLFLDDLVLMKDTYCSRFLLASIMDMACQSFTTFDLRCSTFGVLFEKDAERLWQLEGKTDSPCNLAALCYLAMATGMSGREAVTIPVLTESRAMGARMGMFGVEPSEELIEYFHRFPGGKLRAHAAAAWGAYNWLTYHSMYYVDPPILYPPVLPIPGDQDRYRSGRTWLPQPLPGYAGQTSACLCNLWLASHGSKHLYSVQYPPPTTGENAFRAVEVAYQRLLVWADDLEAQMHRGEHSASHLFFFHAMYHIIIVRMFQPFVNDPTQMRLSSFKAADATPRAIQAASVRQLKRLVVCNWTTSGRHSDNGWFNSAILEVTVSLLKFTEDPDWRIYFQLCFLFWKEAYVRYRVYLEVAKANLVFARRRKKIGSRAAEEMLREVLSAGAHHDASDDVSLSAVMDFEIASKGSQGSRIDILAKELDILAVEHGPTMSNTDRNSII
ncbi:hypothetical protein ACHAO9_004831 [Fusarium lateritium]